MKKTLLATALTLVFASPVLAEDAVATFFAEWDLNSDGEVSQLEARTRLTTIFSTFDTNLDGYLDSLDTATSEDGDAPDEDGDGAVALQFDDDNGDDRVSMLEFIDRSDEWLNLMDRDDDGVITISDFTLLEG